MAYCQKCGEQIGANDKFCRNCGSKLSYSPRETKEHKQSCTAELVTKPCAYCNGTGEVNVGEVVPVYETCPVCKGDREVRVPGDYVKCRPCDGTGKEDIGEIIRRFGPCRRCRGTGWAPPPPVYR
jgi:DnaJ-class molecular chaperone